jgi:predicted nucleic acid-binding protein
VQLEAPEVLVCDTSYISHRERALRDASRYAHWPKAELDRVAAAVLALTPFTLAEIRVGWTRAHWGPERIAEAERRLHAYVVIPLDETTLSEWVRLRVHCFNAGYTLSDNDLWIAATAISHGLPLVTSDKAQSELPGVTAIYLPPP